MEITMKRFIFVLSGLLLVLTGVPASADDVNVWPSKPVRLIVPFSAGGATDTLVRMLAQSLQKIWGQPVLIENKPGGGTVIATNFVARSAPDGHTMGVVVTAHVINPSLRSDLPYDTLNDLAAVTQIGVQSLVIAANPSFEAKTIPELIALAKKNPGKITYATPGSGTAMHLAIELLNTTAGIHLVHVPYKGGAPAQQDVIGGHVPLLLDVYHSTLPYIQSGRLRAIALLDPQRRASAPQIPVIAETVPGVSALSLIGLVVPRATPRNIVAKASADISSVVRSAEFAARFAQSGVEPMGSTPEEFDSVIRHEIAKWAPVVKASGARTD
jgi:tripartite-type tricarboxylate transporter receptor subunit TctC